MNDYYDGVAGARRLVLELDQLLQQLLDNLGHAEELECAIELRVEGGESVRLNRTYKPTTLSEPDGK